MERYFAWKNADCKGINPEWIEIDADEYYKISKPSSNRRFIPSTDEDNPLSDCFYYETTEENYKSWNRDRMRYVRHNQKLYQDFKVVSFDDLVDGEDEDGLTWAEIIPDTSEEDAQYEEEVEANKNLMIKMLPAAMNELPKNQRVVVDLILAWYEEEIERRKEEERNIKEEWKRNILKERPFIIPEDELSKKINVPKRTFNYRKNAAFEKMRDFYEKNLPERKILCNRK